jgi:predicted MFS family arabinose efflux permease
MSSSIASPPQPARLEQAYATIWVATLLFFGAFYTLLVPLPGYLVYVGLADWQVGLVLGAFGVAAPLGRPLAGLAADRWGARPVLLAGALSFVLGAVAMPSARSLGALFMLRLCQAAGYVAFSTAGTALVIRLTPPESRARRLATFGAAANLAITCVPAVMGIALVAALPVAAFYAAGLFALLAGALVLRLGVHPAERPHAMPRATSASQLFPPMLAAALTGAGFAAFFQFAPLFAERRGGLPAELLYTLYGLGIISTRLLAGPLLDRWGSPPALTLGAGLLSGGLGLLALASSPAVTGLATLLVAAGSGLAHPSLLTQHAALWPAAPGRASAAFYVGFDLGIGLGSALFGLLLELGGIVSLYGGAALLTLATLPLVPLLTRR